MPHVFGPGGRRRVDAADEQATTSDDIGDRHKSGSKRQLSEHSEQQPTSSGMIAPQPQVFNDYEHRPSSDAAEARQRASPRVSSSTATSSLVAVLEHTNRDNECVFYDYKAVSGERRCNLTNKQPNSSFTRASMCRPYAVGSRTPRPSCSRSDFPRFTGSTAMKSCCRRRCFRSSCLMNAATSCSLQK